MLTVAIIGLGNRGRKYAYHFTSLGAKVTAVCDVNKGMLEYIRKKYDIPENMAFDNEEDFFRAGKLADALVISTQDRDHYRHAVKGMELNYHLLCEKPVSPVLEQCEELERMSREKGLKMVVCHVLRYAPYYDKIKQIIDSGVIGELTNIVQTENVGYWHFAHSYVRGNWRREDETGPSILAKCCHDLDLFYYFTGKECSEVFSVGERRVFLPENRPEGAPDRCLDGCPYSKTCPYEVSKLYYKPTLKTIPWLIGHVKVITGKGNPRKKDIVHALKTSPYGRCVYACDNDVMENQVVSCKMGNVNATLTMTAQTARCYRRTHIMGTKGEIIGRDSDGFFKLNVFGELPKKIRVSSGIGHLGGDRGVVKDFIELMETGEVTPRLSMMDKTIMSHRMAFAAEESRKSGEAVRLK